MRLMFKFICILFVITQIYSQSIYQRWNKVDSLIWINHIKKDNAIDSIQNYTKLTKLECRNKNYISTNRNKWCFPMVGWTKIEHRSNGNDYRDERFDYFQGGESKGHPAHDIFILDSDSNGVEDSTLKSVYAVSMVNGVVFSVHSNWERSDFLRSGNFVKVFDPKSEGIFYYSHLDSVFVNPGDFVEAGNILGTIGRTGRKAIRGKTHLHIAYYKIEDGEPIPENIIKDLYDAEKRMNEKKQN